MRGLGAASCYEQGQGRLIGPRDTERSQSFPPTKVGCPITRPESARCTAAGQTLSTMNRGIHTYIHPSSGLIGGRDGMPRRTKKNCLPGTCSSYLTLTYIERHRLGYHPMFLEGRPGHWLRGTNRERGHWEKRSHIFHGVLFSFFFFFLSCVLSFLGVSCLFLYERFRRPGNAHVAGGAFVH